MTTTRFAKDFNGLTVLIVDHNLGTWPIVQVLDSGTGIVQAPVSIQQDSANKCTVTMALPGPYRVVCVI